MPKKEGLTKDGLRSMESYYEPMMNADYGSVVAYRTHVRINDPDLGVLLPQYYMPTAERTTLANRVSLWGINDVSSAIPRLKKRDAYFDFISVYIPEKLLLAEDFTQNLIKHITENGAKPDNIAIELSASVFNSDIKAVNKVFSQLSQNNIKTILSGFGLGTAFIGRLEMLHFDYIMLDSSISSYLVTNDEKKLSMAQSLFDLIASQDSSPVATGVSTTEIQNSLPKSCVLFTGSKAGRMKKAANIR